jgi:hypothetical protein
MFSWQFLIDETAATASRLCLLLTSSKFSPMVLLRMREHSPECGDRVTARAQTCLPSIALAAEGLRTPGTAFADVNEFLKILTSIFVIRMLVCSVVQELRPVVA